MPSAATPLAATLRGDLQDWDKERLKLCCKVITRCVKLTTFLLHDNADIFSPVTSKEFQHL
jgi:hypothetical protein